MWKGVDPRGENDHLLCLRWPSGSLATMQVDEIKSDQKRTKKIRSNKKTIEVIRENYMWGPFISEWGP